MSKITPIAITSTINTREITPTITNVLGLTF